MNTRTLNAQRSTLNAQPAFTLVELLAVITIIALLVVLALPGLKALQGTALQTASRQVANEMQLARQYAITRRTPVRFVIGIDLGSGSSKLSSNLVCRGYMICAAQRDALNNNVLFWVPLQDWRVLPDGIVFSENNASSYNVLTATAPPRVGVDTRSAGSGSPAWQFFNNNVTLVITNLAGSGTTNAIVSFVEFKPSGVANGAYITGYGGGIRLVQGAVATVASPPTLVVNSSNNWTFIEYSQYAGRVRLRTPDSYKP